MMRCTKCGGVVVTKIFAEVRPDQPRVWFWALRCSRCDYLVDAGLRPEPHSYVASRILPLWIPPLAN